MEVWQWIITACGGISALGGAIGYVRKLTRPYREHARDVEKLKEQNKRDLERFDAISAQLEQARQANQAVYKALMSMMNHMIDNNSIETLKTARKELSKFIIEH